MSIRIDEIRCRGCGRCREVCPGGLLYQTEETTEIRYPNRCWGCTSCVKECGYGAIAYFLAPDIGGRGSSLTIQRDGENLHWIMRDAQGRTTVLTVNGKQANAY